MQHIALRLAVHHGNRGFEIHGLANIRIVGLAKGAGGVLFHLFLNGRLAVLFLDGHIGHGGIQRAQRAQIGLHQIVAQIQTGERHRAGISRLLAVVGNAILCKFNRLGRKVRRRSFFFPRHIAQFVDIDVIQAFSAFRKKRRPLRTALIVQRLVILTMAVQVKDPVNGIRLTLNRIINGNVSFSGSRRSSRQRQHQHQRK